MKLHRDDRSVEQLLLSKYTLMTLCLFSIFYITLLIGHVYNNAIRVYTVYINSLVWGHQTVANAGIYHMPVLSDGMTYGRVDGVLPVYFEKSENISGFKERYSRCSILEWEFVFGGFKEYIQLSLLIIPTDIQALSWIWHHVSQQTNIQKWAKLQEYHVSCWPGFYFQNHQPKPTVPPKDLTSRGSPRKCSASAETWGNWRRKLHTLRAFGRLADRFYRGITVGKPNRSL